MTMDKTSDWDLAPHDDPEFVAAWCKMEDEGYVYSESNVAKVHLGWLMARKYAVIEATGVIELRDKAENLIIAIGMGWDLDGCVEALQTQLAKGSE